MNTLNLVTVFILVFSNAQFIECQTFRPNQPPMFVAGGDLSRFSVPENTPVGTVVYR